MMKIIIENNAFDFPDNHVTLNGIFLNLLLVFLLRDEKTCQNKT